MSDNARRIQFKGFAKALLKELIDNALDEYGLVTEGRDHYADLNHDLTVCEDIIARRAYDFEAHTVGHTLEYLHECGREMPGGMKARIVPSIPDMVELPKDEV